VPGPASPPSFSMPPVSAAIPASSHPAVPAACGGGRVTWATGTPGGDGRRPAPPVEARVLMPAELLTRVAQVRSAIAAARPTSPHAAANLEHWLDGGGATRWMPTAAFLHRESGLEDFLLDDARPHIMRGAEARLRDASHAQGSLRPPGVVRFLQYRSGLRPPSTGAATGLAPHAADLAIAVGAYMVHSAVWLRVSARRIETSGFLGLTRTEVLTVSVVRWCVQVQDLYDWNLGAQTGILIAANRVANVPMPAGALRVERLGPFALVRINDEWMREVEVSGGGHGYFVYTEPFEAPASVRRSFEVRI
jgi:hypothetical protein